MTQMKVALSAPIKNNEGREVSELTFQEPTIGLLEDINLERTADGGVRFNLGAIPRIIAELGDVPVHQAKRIPLRDLAKFKDVLASFFAEFQGTGGR